MKKVHKLDAEGLWAYAVRALGGRAHSTGELRAKLRERAEKMGDVDTVLARLKELGYLDDRRFADAFASARLENQRVGRMRALHDLRSRRVAPSLAEQAVNRAYAETDEIQLIEEYLHRKLKIGDRPELLSDDRKLAAAFRRLVRAGFGRGNVIGVLKRYARDAAVLEAAETAEEPREEEL